ncbi:wac domain-containing protein [Fusarium mundagurra]|uniref:Wac domain-containing protein n=1 Tax=Fusarium mundagurra TaxID=1567541 RepID=A0A8H5YQ89_9HYPO|nr:wac domain-containing protein [Fusarium mundagurra]
MENGIIQQIREELSGSRDEIRNDPKTVSESIKGARSDVDTNKNDIHEFRDSVTKELQAVTQGLRSDIETNTKDIRDLRESITEELQAVHHEFRSDIDINTKDIRTLRNSVTKEFEAVRERDADLRNALDHEFKSVDDRFQDVHQRFDKMKTELARIKAIGQNGRLSNPFLPIHALPIYLPNQGITYPEATHFPKNANEFYALKQPTGERQTAMLAYLAMFYDVSNYKKQGDIAIHDPEETLGYLEDILGLEEERFIRFKARAHELYQEPKVAPIKRSQIDT